MSAVSTIGMSGEADGWIASQMDTEFDNSWGCNSSESSQVRFDEGDEALGNDTGKQLKHKTRIASKAPVSQNLSVLLDGATTTPNNHRYRTTSTRPFRWHTWLAPPPRLPISVNVGLNVSKKSIEITSIPFWYFPVLLSFRTWNRTRPQRVLMNDLHVGLMPFWKYPQPEADKPLQSYNVGPDSIFKFPSGLLLKAQPLLHPNYSVRINV